jgi:membrane associated rhomboid family serine protease
MHSATSRFNSIPPVTKNILILNVILWLAAMTLPRFTGINLAEWLGLHYWQAESFNPAQFISYMFMHFTGSITHIFFNMFALYMFGSVLEYRWGSKRFLSYYLITGIGAGIVQQIVWTIDIMPMLKEINAMNYSGIMRDGIIYSVQEYLNMPITRGASGAVFGLLLAFGMLYPDQPLYLMFIPIPIKAKYFVIGYAVIELLLGMGNFSFDNIAHFAHLGGMIFGYFLIIYWKKR